MSGTGETVLPPEIRPGTRLGTYRIEGELGRGGMGVVLKAQDDLGRTVAIKVLPRDLVSDPKRLERFKREALAGARVVHPNVTLVYTHGEANGWPFVVFEFMPGGSLHDRVKKEGAIPWRKAVQLAVPIARGLGAVHKAGLVHRDLKPANVLLDASGNPKLGDFGLARTVERGNSLTGAGEVVGTAQYLAPEQAGEGRVDARADLYALGCTLYCLLTGAPPFEGEGLSVITKHLTARPVPPSQRVAGIPKAVDAIVLRLLEKKPEQRGESADAVADELEALLEAKEAPTKGGPAPRRVALVVGGSAGVLAVLAAVAIFARSPGTPAPTAPPPVPAFEVVLDEPREGEDFVAGQRIRVRGRIEPDVGVARVKANGTRELAVTKGRFEGLVPAGSALTSLEVAAVWSGVTRTAERKVHAAPAPTWWLALAEDARPELPLPRHFAWNAGRGVFVYTPDVTPAVEIELVYVPKGPFTMGATGLQSQNAEDEPEHTHWLASGLFMARYETTRKQYFAFCDAVGWKKPPLPMWGGYLPDENHPIVQVRLEDAHAFCRWAGVRLPYEAEWEKAARGSKDARLYPWGGSADELGELGGISADCPRRLAPDGRAWTNFCDSGVPTPAQGGVRDPGWGDPLVNDGYPHTAPVGSFKHDLSPYGCYDMAGNVEEMCEDYYESHVYERYAMGHFEPPASGQGHVVRGGGWDVPWWNCRVTSRPGAGQLAEGVSTPGIGFRVAVSEE